MGLLDVLNGMQHGPRGPSDPSAQSSGGMSPMTMAILGAARLEGGQAFYAATSRAQPPASAPSSGNPAGGPTAGGAGGGLGDLLKGGLGGLLAGGAAGSVLSGGLGDLLKQFQQRARGSRQFMGRHGPNKQISPDDLGRALGADQINALSAQSGLSRDELLAGLSRHLPDVINHLTPDGRLPSDSELSGRI